MNYGYQHKTYAQSFEEFGTPIHLAKSDSWILTQDIPGTAFRDAIGCYPIFCCSDWSFLAADLTKQNDSIISLTMVTDPFGKYDQACLKKCFPSLVIPFKQHHVVELSQNRDLFVHPHHKKKARKALQAVSAEPLSPSDTLLVEWIGLYDNLIARHHIRGISAFSTRSFATQFRVPGLVIFRAEYEADCVGMILWYVMGDVAYYHLGAYNDAGYRFKASFALFWESIVYFKELGLRWLSLGAGAGKQQREDGLTRFKSGWANCTRTAYLCGRIFNQTAYEELVEKRRQMDTKFFPAYRSQENV